jgi:hypothetical protein
MTKNAENPTKIASLCEWIRVRIFKAVKMKWRWNVPYEYIPFFFDHYEMDAGALMFAHERVWDEVEKDI